MLLAIAVGEQETDIYLLVLLGQKLKGMVVATRNSYKHWNIFTATRNQYVIFQILEGLRSM